jgi:hypothetical protein
MLLVSCSVQLGLHTSFSSSSWLLPVSPMPANAPAPTTPTPSSTQVATGTGRIVSILTTGAGASCVVAGGFGCSKRTLKRR